MTNIWSDNLPGNSANDFINTEMIAMQSLIASWPLRFASLLHDFAHSAPHFHVTKSGEHWYAFGVSGTEHMVTILPASLTILDEGSSKMSYIEALEELEGLYERFKNHRQVRNAVSRLTADDIKAIDDWYAKGNRISKDMTWG